MFGYWKSRAEVRRAKRAYEMAVLEGLIEQNRARLRELEEWEECKWCKAMEKPEQREECRVEFARCPDDCPAVADA